MEWIWVQSDHFTASVPTGSTGPACLVALLLLFIVLGLRTVRGHPAASGGGGDAPCTSLYPSTSIRTGPRPRGEGSPVFVTICELSS